MILLCEFLNFFLALPIKLIRKNDPGLSIDKEKCVGPRSSRATKSLKCAALDAFSYWEIRNLDLKIIRFRLKYQVVRVFLQFFEHSCASYIMYSSMVCTYDTWGTRMQKRNGASVEC